MSFFEWQINSFDVVDLGRSMILQIVLSHNFAMNNYFKLYRWV